MKHIAAIFAVAAGILFISLPAAAAEPDYTRTPILMVHGYFPSSAAEWVTWGRFRSKLIEDGWPEEYVYAPQFADTTGCDPDHAREISAWVDELRTATGVDKIDIVAHSEGGLNTMYYLRYFCGVHKVKNFVGLAIAVHGTIVACVDFISCGADEMCIDTGDDGWKSNAGLVAVNDCDETPGDILYTSIWSEYDEIIIPQKGSMLAGARNIEMESFAEHGLIFLENESLGYIEDALLNNTGLNTDGPGWDCIDYCVIPDQPDTAEVSDADAFVADDASDVSEPADSGAGDADPGATFDAAVPPLDAGHEGDLVTTDGSTVRDGLDGDETVNDVSTVEAVPDNGGDSGTSNHTGGCNAGSGSAEPLALIACLFLALISVSRRVRARS